MKKGLLILGILIAVLSLTLFGVACKKEAFPIRIEVTMPPDDLSVEQGGSIDFTGCILTATYEDGSRKEISTQEIEVRKFDSEKIGTQTVELVYARDGRQVSVVLTVKVVEPAVLSLSLEGELVTEYMEGEYFRTSGITVYAHYKNGSTKEVKNFTVTPSGKLSASVTEVSIGHGGAKYVLPIVVRKKAPLTISFLTPPTDSEYYVGDLFSAEGLTAKVTYNDGTEETFSAEKLLFTHSDGSAYAAPSDGEDMPYVTANTACGSITARYEGLTVLEILPTSIRAEVTGDPLVFVEGEIFSFRSEVAVTVVYNNGEEEFFPIADPSIFSFERASLKRTDRSILIWLGEYDNIKGVLSPITVLAPNLTSITAYPSKTEYYVGDPFDPTDLVLTLHYDNDSEKTLEYAEGIGITYSAIVDSEEEQRAYVVIEYEGFSVECEVHLYERPIE